MDNCDHESFQERDMNITPKTFFSISNTSLKETTNTIRAFLKQFKHDSSNNSITKVVFQLKSDTPPPKLGATQAMPGRPGDLHIRLATKYHSTHMKAFAEHVPLAHSLSKFTLIRIRFSNQHMTTASRSCLRHQRLTIVSDIRPLLWDPKTASGWKQHNQSLALQRLCDTNTYAYHLGDDPQQPHT
jgi:hypothetical protein